MEIACQRERVVPAASFHRETILAEAPTSKRILPIRDSIIHDVGIVLQIEGRDRRPDQDTDGKSQQTNNIANALDSLLLVYNDARKAFHAEPPKSIAATQAAKFLRDTAENVVHYIRSLQPHHASSRLPPLNDAYHSKILDELLGTILRTSKFVERRSGGTKRSWEHSNERGRMIGSLVSQQKTSVPQQKESAPQLKESVSKLKESVSQHNKKLRRGKGRTRTRKRRHGSAHVSPDERAKLTSNLRQETFLSHYDPSRSYCFHRAVSEHRGQSNFIDQNQSIYMGQSTFVGQSTFMSVTDTYRPKYE